MNKLHTLEVTRPIQDGDFTSARANSLLQETYDEAISITNIDGVSLNDENNKVVNYISSSVKKPEFIGYDLSNRPPFIEYLKNLPDPTFTHAFPSVIDGTLRVSLFYPVYNQDTGKYLGAIRASLIVHDFLSKYGNLDDSNSQYLMILDRNATVMTSAFKDNIGLNFFSEHVSQGSSQARYDHYRKVLSGESNAAVLNYRNAGERFNTGVPITIRGKPIYFAFVITPTASIYSEIDSLIASERTGFYLLQGAVAAAIAISLFFLIRWSGTLEKEVKNRTRELQEANEQLKMQSKTQTEFINIAAHELRTPVQPILGMAEILGAYPTKAEEEEEEEEEVRIKKKDLRMIGRNAARLERLSSDILDVSRIDSGSFRLSKMTFDINELIREAIGDAKRHSDIADVKIMSISINPSISIVADKQRIIQVVINLLNNAIRFTRPTGTITVKVEPHQNDSINVLVTDTGAGIGQDVLPKLFTKFSSSTRAGSGTGLGLYISKAIIEAHGGRIWGENNANGKGATFGFEIPNALATKDRVEEIEEDDDGNEYSDSILTTLAKEAFENS
jgi:signal transduction histidine kinase